MGSSDDHDSAYRGEIMPLFILTFWRELLIALLIISWSCTTWYLNGAIDDRDTSITTLTAESKLNEIQKDTLRQAILDQSEAVEKQRIDAEKRAAKFEAESKRIWSDFERTKEQVKDLSGDAECQAMREIIRGAVE